MPDIEEYNKYNKKELEKEFFTNEKLLKECDIFDVLTFNEKGWRDIEDIFWELAEKINNSDLSTEEKLERFPNWFSFWGEKGWQISQLLHKKAKENSAFVIKIVDTNDREILCWPVTWGINRGDILANLAYHRNYLQPYLLDLNVIEDWERGKFPSVARINFGLAHSIGGASENILRILKKFKPDFYNWIIKNTDALEVTD